MFICNKDAEHFTNYEAIEENNNKNIKVYLKAAKTQINNGASNQINYRHTYVCCIL